MALQRRLLSQFSFPLLRTGGLCGLLALTLCTGALRAANLVSVTPAAISLTCNTATGPGPAATVVVKPVAALTSGTLAVTVSPLGSGLQVTPPASTTLNASNQAQGLTFSVRVGAGCVGAATGSTSLRFTIGSVADAMVTVNSTVAAPVSALVAPPVRVTCTRNAGPPVTYTSGGAQTATVSSGAAGGTPFSIDPTSYPAWLVVGPLAGTASAAGVPITIAAMPSCGSYAAGSANPVSIRLRNAPAPDSAIPVTVQILGPSPLTASPKAPALSYVKGSDTAAAVDVTLTAGTGSPAFSVDTASLPAWLTVDAFTGAAPKTLRFSTTGAADTLATGTYPASVRVKVTGSADFVLPVSLVVSGAPPRLTVAEGLAREISWTVGQPAPTAYITVASTGSTIPYTITTGGAAAPTVSAGLLKGFAYSSGTPIPLTFDPAVLAAAPPGSVVIGTVTFAWGSPASTTVVTTVVPTVVPTVVTTVVTFNVTVQPAGATLLAIAPTSLPTSAAGQKFTVVLNGTGFVAGPDPARQTFVGIVTGGWLVADANLSVSVVNPSNIILTVRVPAAADANLPFSPTGTGGTVIFGVCNPGSANPSGGNPSGGNPGGANPGDAPCSVPTGTAQLTIGVNPLIQAVTSASSFVQASPPSLPTVAPYDMLSIFGTSFCSSGGTGCDNSQVLFGMVDPATQHYPSSLSPDPAGPAQRWLTVTFQTHAVPPVTIARAPLLIATNTQINLVVPSAVAAYVGKAIDLVVSFGYGPAATVLNSDPFAMNVVAANPGVFTVGAEGEGAILGMDWNVITTGNEAAMRSNPADSDTVQIYMTGLGVPDGTADNATAGTGLWPADCISIPSYLSALNLMISGSFLSVDGALIPSSLFNSNRLPPCLRSTAAIPAVTIGGQPAVVTYAGWVPDSVVGQYQVNVRLPGSNAGTFTTATGAAIAPPLTVPVKLAMVVTARNRSSQPGVTIAVAPRLKVAPPGVLTGKAGTAWTASGNLVTASQGTPGYHYVVAAGVLPTGVALNAATGALSGTLAVDSAGAYPIMVGVTDSAAAPLTGKVGFTLTVSGGR